MGEEGSHQISNTSDEPLRYLCLSTMDEPDVLVYPDSGKIGVFAGSAPGGPKEKRTLHKYLRAGAEVATSTARSRRATKNDPRRSSEGRTHLSLRRYLVFQHVRL